MKSYAHFLLRHRRLMSALLLVLIGASAASLPFLRIDLSVIPIFEANQDFVAEVREFEATFPAPRVDLPIVLEWPDPIGGPELDTLRALGEAIAERPHVTDVTSLATTPLVERAESGEGVRVRPFHPLEPGETVAAKVARHPLIDGTLISADRRSAALLVSSDFIPGDTRRRAWLEDIEAVVAERVHPPVGVRMLGGEIVERTMSGTIKRDMIQGVAIEAIFFIFLLPMLFRTWRGMAIPLGAVGSALLLNFGFMVGSGRAVTVLGVAVPGLIVAIALCDAIHMMHRFEEAFARTRKKELAVIEMMENVGLACLYTSLTTAIGFLSLAAADHAAVRQLGVSVSIGVMIGFFCVITIMPLGLAFWPARDPRSGGLRFLDHIRFGRRALTIGVFAAAIVASLVGTRRIVIDSTWLGELPPESKVVQDLAWYENNFRGLLTMEIEIRGELDRPEALRALEPFEAAIISQEGLTGVDSYTGWVREMIGNPATATDEDLARGIATLKLAGDAFPRDLITPEFDRARLVFSSQDVGMRRYHEIKANLEAEAGRLGAGLRAAEAGYSRMAFESSSMVLTSLLRSLLLSFAGITLFVMIGYRSVRLGLISTLPNLFPILVALGLTGWLGIELRIGVVMVYCAGVGLAVDDSIHMITRFVQERAASPDATNHESLVRTLRTTGKALVTTSVVLSVGALSYLPSHFRSISDVGVLLTSVIVAALFADLFLLPILLERFAGGAPRATRLD